VLNMSRHLASRVVLRAPSQDDREAFVAAMQASRRLHEPWLTAPASPVEFSRLLQRAAGERFESLLVRRREDDEIVGFFTLSEIVRGSFQSAYLAYGAVVGFERRGYMSEGLLLLLHHAFKTLGMHRVEANIQPANTGSIALVRRAGFVREGYSERYLKIGGRWRDHERWAMRAEQWRAMRTARN
jgi:[ribosomal protein S5]-alanine N-acetyltransferase